MSKTVTLLFLRRDDQILLAMKKRGFGAGLWNGVGGKLDPGETIEQAMIRECQEEIDVTPLEYEKVAVHEFQEFSNNQPTTMTVHTYACIKWSGDPAESEEMRPEWFKTDTLPFDSMWPDDPLWLPQVLVGKKLRTVFVLDQANKIIESEIIEVESLDA